MGVRLSIIKVRVVFSEMQNVYPMRFRGVNSTLEIQTVTSSGDPVRGAWGVGRKALGISSGFRGCKEMNRMGH